MYRLVSIACQETGFGADKKSSLYSQNNPGGLNAGGPYFTYEKVDEGIYKMAELLRKYKERGKETLSDIKPIYCPDDDPRNLSGEMKGFNQHWLPNTIKTYNMLVDMEVTK